jgi:hypothetical protein
MLLIYCTFLQTQNKKLSKMPINCRPTKLMNSLIYYEHSIFLIIHAQIICFYGSSVGHSYVHLQSCGVHIKFMQSTCLSVSKDETTWNLLNRFSQSFTLENFIKNCQVISVCIYIGQLKIYMCSCIYLECNVLNIFKSICFQQHLRKTKKHSSC